MKILSIDVGIKNMAFCFIESNPSPEQNRILKWDIVNVSQPIDLKCCGKTKEGNQCECIVKFEKEGNHYCMKHSKKQTFIAPHRELDATSLRKQKIMKLYELADKYDIAYSNPIKKVELLSLFYEYVNIKCFENVEMVNSSKMDLITIGRNIQIRMDEIFQDDFGSIDAVIIENQISPIANRMKTIQGMVTQYFIIRSPQAKIEFISAANKLKGYNNEQKKELKYSERKKLGITLCLEKIINHPEYLTWESFFKKHSKKDDLSDAFLQLLWYLQK